MRSDARKRGKKVPTWKQLDEMLLECVDEHGNLEGCSSCGQQMQWRAGEDRKIGASISLQHNHDDTECFICHSCNAGHGGSKLGDRYLGLTAKGLKHCVNCGKNKPFDQFGNRKSRNRGLYDICSECNKERSRKHYHDNIKSNPSKRAERLMHERERYAKIKADPEKYAEYLANKREYRKARRQKSMDRKKAQAVSSQC